MAEYVRKGNESGGQPNGYVLASSIVVCSALLSSMLHIAPSSGIATVATTSYCQGRAWTTRSVHILYNPKL